MKKKGSVRYVALVLALCLLLPGCKPEKAAPQQLTPIRTAQQLRQMDPAGSYVLEADIDLGGESWQPMDFSGYLEGNGRKISNFTLTESKNGNLGFFGCNQGQIFRLSLENVTLTAGEDAQFAGILAGTNQGRLEGCTVTGTITDQRADRCLGVMVGKNQGQLLGGGCLSASAGSSNPEDKAENLSAKVALRLPADRRIGLAGQTSVENVDIAMVWQDASASFEALPQQEKQLRQAVVDKMHQMGTVKWTVSQEITYTANDNRKSIHSNAFLPGRTYIGLPYNGCEGSYERFLTQMQPQTDDQGRLVTVTGLEEGIKTKAGQVSGFITAMGNDCVGAVIWALGAAVPYSVEDGGMAFLSPIEMVPNAYNMENFGAIPAGGYEMIESDLEKYPTSLDARDTKTIISLNGGAVKMAEFYQAAYRGDYLLCLNYTYDAATDKWKKTSNHGRMLAYEPMIIRGWNGDINLEKSYVITHEQGDGLYDNRLENGEYESYKGFDLKTSSWRTDYKYSLSLLLTKSGYNAAVLPGTGYGYIPVTLGVYTREETVEFSCAPIGDLKLPNMGLLESNYLMTHGTMTIRDAQGEPVYEKTAYLPDRVFADFTRMDLKVLFPDVAEGLTEGKTYHETLTVYTTGGMECTVVDESFTY